jgi:hypothetical protein
MTVPAIDGIKLPPSLDPVTKRPICEECGDPINPDALAVFSAVTGWAQNRRDGGAHAITKRRDFGIWRHPQCLKHPGQGSFL